LTPTFSFLCCCAEIQPFIALTLHLDGRLWTGDDELKAGLRAKGFDRFFEP
jgi:predicted nucleic acid-binding protein